MANPNPNPKGRFKKGVSGNPQGGRIQNPILRALRNLTIKEYREVIELALTSNLASLKALAADPEASAIQAGVAIALGKAIQRGDWNVINAIAERIVGKIPDRLDVSGLPVAPPAQVVIMLPDNGRSAKAEK